MKGIYNKAESKKLPRETGKGKVVWIEGKSDNDNIWKWLTLRIMTHQGTSKETNKTMNVTIYNVDLKKPEFSKIKKLAELRADKDNMKYPIITFSYYTSKKEAIKDNQPEYVEIQKEINGVMKTILQPKFWINNRMSAEDCKDIKIIAEDSDAPIWFSDEKTEGDSEIVEEEEISE